MTTSDINRDYTPPTINPTQVPVTYDLVKDVTGKPAPKRGPQILKDIKGNQMKVPYPPKINCKKCYGRGYIGTDVITNELIVCRKCYPFNK